MDELKEKALAYHCMDGKPGKIQVACIHARSCQACFGNSGESAKRL